MTTPVLVADGVRIAIDDATVVSELTLRTTGARVVVAGDSHGLLAALLGTPRVAQTADGGGPRGQPRVVAGSLRLCDRDVAAGQHRAIAGLAPLDPPLPLTWTVEEYLCWSARLAGGSARAARDQTASVLKLLGMTDGRRRPLRTLPNAERRVVVLAQAVLGVPEVLVCELPLHDLDPRGAALVGQVLATAAENRAMIASVAQLAPPGPEAELVRQASDLCLLRGGRLVLHAQPDEAWGQARIVEITVSRNAESLRARLDAEGAVIHGGPMHFAIALPAPMELTDLLAAAAAVQAPVVRCVPLIQSPA